MNSKFNKRQFARIKSCVILLLNLIALTLLSLWSFNRNPGRLLTGLDGPTLVAASKEQFTFFGMSVDLHSNILEGLGNTAPLNNFTLMPSLFNQLGEYSPALFYTWFAIQLFISVLILGRNYKFSFRVTYVAAWLLTILFLPYFADFRVYSITETAPQCIQLILTFAITCFGIQKMGEVNWPRTIFFGAITLLGLILGFILCTVGVMLAVPMLFMLTICSFVTVQSRSEFIRKLLMGLVISSIIILAGWLHYSFGLVLDTAANIYGVEMTGLYHALIYVSILFHKGLLGSGAGPWLFIIATLGALFAIWKSSILRPIAITTVIAQLIIIGSGILLVLQLHPWNGPSPIYWEIVLLPFYALFSIYFVSQLISKIVNISKSKWIDTAFPFAVTASLMMIFLLQQPFVDRSTSYALPPSTSPIIEILKNEVALSPNAVFKGRVANILVDKDLYEQCAYFMKVNAITGNDHQSSGLWLNNIPTLHEYNQGISPGFYRLSQRFLSNPSLNVYRNWSNFSKINLDILKLLGVRFIISTTFPIEHTKLRTKLVIRNNNESFSPLYLYEIPHTNIAGISAQHLVTVDTIQQAEDSMAARHFNLQDAVIFSNHRIDTMRLVPAVNSKLTIEKGGYHLQAESKGKTLLILPIEYSHCLNVNTFSGSVPQIMRVDIALVGVMFDRKVDMLVDNKASLFTNPRCKLQDYSEFVSWKHFSSKV